MLSLNVLGIAAPGGFQQDHFVISLYYHSQTYTYPVL